MKKEDKIVFLKKEIKEIGKKAIENIQDDFLYMAKIRLERMVFMNDELNRLIQKK